MDSRARSAEAQDYAASLEYTLKELQRKVKEHETTLNKVRSLPAPLQRPTHKEVDKGLRS